MAFLEVLIGLRCGRGSAEGGCGEEQERKRVEVHRSCLLEEKKSKIDEDTAKKCEEAGRGLSMYK